MCPHKLRNSWRPPAIMRQPGWNEYRDGVPKDSIQISDDRVLKWIRVWTALQKKMKNFVDTPLLYSKFGTQV